MKTIFTKELWDAYVQKVEKDFKLKTYPQLDPYFNFKKDKVILFDLLSDPSLKRMKNHNFTPLIKILQKTPRYKWQEDKELSAGGKYNLETKIRPISFASHFDTYIYGFYSFALNIKYQDYIHKNGFQEVVLAYRSDLEGKCNIQFAKEAFDQIKKSFKEEGECSVIALDIKGYFDHIDHSILKKMWCKIIDEDDLPLDQYKVYRSLTKYSYVNYGSFLKHFNINLKKLEKEQKKKHKGKKNVPKGYQSLFDLIPNDINGSTFHDKMELLRKRKLVAINRTKDRSYSKNGIPQGSALSALLSNIYLAEFDKNIFEKGQNEGFVYRRYCDDLLIICKPEQVNPLKNYIIDLINNDYKLIIQNRKTDVIDFMPSQNGQIRSFRREFDTKKEIFNSLPNEEINFKNLQYLGFEFNGKSIYVRPGSLSRYFRKMKARVAKSISMAYSENAKSDIIFKQQIYSRYSHLGKKNFLSYVKNASKRYYSNSAGEKKDGMNSPSIKRQVAAHMRILKQEIEKTSRQRAKQKGVDIIKK
ncbi:reverse transcriptase domain-containing protein [Algoriphagus vanfongensis]|uniref:reverse transcriptase domain-containing protein n=1 Tax=Algoriphagus vanfongensis TaxID=426371 RepID=UPI00040D34B7|nr:reverse transcriptase domain-containing protein [Algoriphagus vanfongensis]